MTNKNRFRTLKSAIKKSLHAKQHFDRIIGLGNWCQTSYQLRRNNLQLCSYPFDWIAMPDISAYKKIFNNSFADFLNIEYLEKIDTKYNHIRVRHKKYATIFPHDFAGPEINDDYELIFSKYQRRINRLYSHIKHAKTILFVIYCGSDAINEIKELHSYLTHTFSGKKIKMWWLVPRNDKSGISKQIVSDGLERYTFDSRYTGDNPADEYKGNDRPYDEIYHNVSLSYKTLFQTLFRISNE